jgi:hypothetical protein
MGSAPIIFTIEPQPVDTFRAETALFYSYRFDLLERHLASQAAYEGSIPFARSNSHHA